MPHCLLIRDEIVSIALSSFISPSLSLAPPANSTTPTFTIVPVDTVAVAGSRVIIECLGHAHPTPDLEWIIIHNVHFPKEGGVLPTGGLQFDPVTSEDAATYRCRLSNSADSVYTTISLVVKGEKNYKHLVMFQHVCMHFPK